MRRETFRMHLPGCGNDATGRQRDVSTHDPTVPSLGQLSPPVSRYQTPACARACAIATEELAASQGGKASSFFHGPFAGMARCSNGAAAAALAQLLLYPLASPPAAKDTSVTRCEQPQLANRSSSRRVATIASGVTGWQRRNTARAETPDRPGTRPTAPRRGVRADGAPPAPAGNPRGRACAWRASPMQRTAGRPA